MRFLFSLAASLAICTAANAQLLPVSQPLQQRSLPFGVSIPAVTSSSVSYPGCPGEVTTHTHTVYFDQVNGHTQAGGGLGTLAAPWDNLQALTGNNSGTPSSGYTQILLSTAPGGNGSSPVIPGDLILVNTGSYGAVSLGVSTAIANSPAITIKANTGQTPLFTTLAAQEMTGLHLEGLKVQGTGAGNGGLVYIADNSVAHSTSDIILENMDISSASVATADTWSSKATWVANARPGVMFFSQAGENPSTAMTCVSVVNSHIYVVSNPSQFGSIELEAGSSLIQGNEIDHFYAFGIKFYESNYAIGNNYIHDVVQTASAPIFYAIFQGIDSTLDPTEWQSNVYLYNNKAIENADANLLSTFQGSLSAYLNSTGDVTNFVALDNLMDGSGSCAICAGNAHNFVVANNSSMYSGNSGGQNPVMNFTQAHAGAAGFGTGPIGRQPSNGRVFNNIGNIFECLNQDGVQCYHNISAPATTGFPSWTYQGTLSGNPTFSPGWNTLFTSPTPGSVVTVDPQSGQQNLIDGGVGGASPQNNEFTSVPVPGTWPELPLPDWTPLAGSPAATAGGVQLVPPIADYNGIAFAPPYAIGALNPSPLFSLPTGDVIHYISPTGSDAANGLTTGTPWLTANHAMHCGDVIIAAAGSYTTQFQQSKWGAVSNCPSTTGGLDGTGGVYFAVVLCAGPVMTSCSINGGNGEAARIDSNNWAMEGFQGTSTASTGTACFTGSSSVTMSGTSLHHIAFINDIASTCAHDGFNTYPYFADTGAGSVDQTAVVGVAAFAAAQNNAFCNSGVSMIPTNGPDSSAGTHVFVAGVFAWHNIDSPCSGFPDSAVTATTGTPGTLHSASLYTQYEIVQFSSSGTLPAGLTAATNYYVCGTGLVPNTSFEVSTTLTCGTAVALTTTGSGTLTATTQKTTDGEGVIFDSWGLQTFTRQGVIEQSAFWGNGSSGVEVFTNGGTDGSNNYIFSNSSYGNIQDPLHNANNSSEFNLQSVHVGASSIKSVTSNLAQASGAIPAGSNSVQCSPSNYGCPVYGFAIAGTPTIANDAIVTGNLFADLAASCASGNCDAKDATISWDGNNITSAVTNTLAGVSGGITPNFANPSALPTGAPSCGAYISVTHCMNSLYRVASNLASSAGVGLGYAAPGPCAPDPYFPIWLKGIVYLHWDGTSLTEHAGLITKPCGL